MKKSVFILICVIFVIAIFTVNFIGLKVGFYKETVYATSIECINEEAKQGNGYKYIVVDYIDDPNNPTAVQLEWKVNPENVSNNMVEFEYDKTKTVGYVTDNGIVVFNKAGVIVVHIMTTDGSGVKTTVKVYAN